MLRLLSRMFSVAACGALLLGAGSASALSTTYNVNGFGASSLMAQDNSAAGGACTFATCNVAVNGHITLDDDGLGNVSLTSLSLSHAGYEVGPAGLISVVIARTSITLGGGPVAGTGTTIGGAVSFGSSLFAQTGFTKCTPLVLPCLLAGLPTGVSPLTSPIGPLALGSWNFDAFGNLTGATIQYTNQNGAIEQLSLEAAPVPEPGTALLLTVGLVGMALRRRGF